MFADVTKTVAIKACAGCGGGLLETDRFCRWCGVSQSDRGAHLCSSSPLTTTALSEPALYRRVSGPLVSAILTGVSDGAGETYGPLIKRMVLALISIPIWLIIVLLSPLDAYAAARAISRQM
ncbi:MAG TPA: hypothetical protein VIG62_11130 [Blastocatellia bacterium]|jgi:hypothetical protein